MKVLSREFTTKEKVLIAILAAIILVLCYFWVVDFPVRNGIEEAKSQRQSLGVELDAVKTKIKGLEQMQSELDSLGSSGRGGYMASYNNSKAEIAALNDILSDTKEYLVSFDDLTREGDLVRRAFTIEFTTKGYSAAKKTILNLENSEYRCRIGDLSCVVEDKDSSNVDLKKWKGDIKVSATATFYETMVGGVEDEGLPADETENATTDTTAAQD